MGSISYLHIRDGNHILPPFQWWEAYPRDNQFLLCLGLTASLVVHASPIQNKITFFNKCWLELFNRLMVLKLCIILLYEVNSVCVSISKDLFLSGQNYYLIEWIVWIHYLVYNTKYNDNCLCVNSYRKISLTRVDCNDSVVSIMVAKIFCYTILFWNFGSMILS